MTGTAIAVATPVVAAAVLVAWLRRRYVVIEVDGRSMQPTLHEGDRVLVRRRPLRRIRTGDIVVAENPGARLLDSPARRIRNLGRHTWMIKRAVAVPGDPVPASVATTVSVAAGALVPDDRLLVLGDNTVASFDSRSYGYLSGDRVLGVVVRRVLSNVTGAGSLEGVAMTDEELAKNVSVALSEDPKVDSTLIDVVADGGEVLLRGTVGSFWQKREAQKAAERVDGVTNIDNIIDVRLLTEHRRADAELRADVLHALSLNGMIPGTVDASVDDGTVLLSGTVDLEHEREEAVRIAGNVRGVVNVQNDIFLNPPLTDG